MGQEFVDSGCSDRLRIATLCQICWLKPTLFFWSGISAHLGSHPLADGNAKYNHSFLKGLLKIMAFDFSAHGLPMKMFETLM